jgi:hypothetical protein
VKELVNKDGKCPYNNQKGFLVYLPSTHRITISADVLFDESFQTAIITNWHLYRDSLALQPALSFIPNVNTSLKSTSSIEDQPQPVEERNLKRGMMKMMSHHH